MPKLNSLTNFSIIKNIFSKASDAYQVMTAHHSQARPWTTSWTYTQILKLTHTILLTMNRTCQKSLPKGKPKLSPKCHNDNCSNLKCQSRNLNNSLISLNIRFLRYLKLKMWSKIFRNHCSDSSRNIGSMSVGFWGVLMSRKKNFRKLFKDLREKYTLLLNWNNFGCRKEISFIMCSEWFLCNTFENIA